MAPAPMSKDYPVFTNEAESKLGFDIVITWML